MTGRRRRIRAVRAQPEQPVLGRPGQPIGRHRGALQTGVRGIGRRIAQRPSGLRLATVPSSCGWSRVGSLPFVRLWLTDRRSEARDQPPRSQVRRLVASSMRPGSFQGVAMKRPLLSIVTVLFLSLAAGAVQASPLLYVFQGTVTANGCLWVDRLADGGACGVPPGTDIPEGTPVAFRIIIDFDRGFREPGVDTFYAQYLSGPSPWANLPSWSSTLGADTAWPGSTIEPQGWLFGGWDGGWPYWHNKGVFRLYTEGGQRISDMNVSDQIRGVDVFEYRLRTVHSLRRSQVDQHLSGAGTRLVAAVRLGPRWPAGVAEAAAVGHLK